MQRRGCRRRAGRRAFWRFEGHLKRAHGVLVEGITVESLDGEAGVVIISVSDESKALSGARRRVTHHVHFDDGTERSEQSVQIQLSRQRTDAVDVQRVADGRRRPIVIGGRNRRHSGCHRRIRSGAAFVPARTGSRDGVAIGIDD